MLATRIKYKYTIARLDIDKLERFKLVEVRLPSNVKRITGILVTASKK